jgi:hypothetical protein
MGHPTSLSCRGSIHYRPANRSMSGKSLATQKTTLFCRRAPKLAPARSRIWGSRIH